MANTVKHIFTNADLDANFTLTYTHNQNTTNIIPEWYDETGSNRTTAELFQIIDLNTIKLYCGGPITGSHYILIVCADNNTGGKKLFHLPLITILDSDHRLPVGKNDSVLASNITYGNLISTITNSIGNNVLLKSNNLSDLSNLSTARTNLSVYSKAQVDSFIQALINPVSFGFIAAPGQANTIQPGWIMYTIGGTRFLKFRIKGSTTSYTKICTLDASMAYSQTELIHYGICRTNTNNVYEVKLKTNGELWFVNSQNNIDTFEIEITY